MRRGGGAAVRPRRPRLRRPRAASAGCTALTFGDPPTSAGIGLPGEQDCFTFTGAVGDRVRVRVAETSGLLQAVTTIVRPSSSVACGPSNSTEVNCAVNAAGTWTIRVNDKGGSQTGQYAIALQRTSNPVGCAALHQYAPEQKAELACVCVNPTYENQGIGAMLMQYVEAQARGLIPHGRGRVLFRRGKESLSPLGLDP